MGPCGQYRLNKKDIRKRHVFQGQVVMLRTLATKPRTDVFDDATIEAQPPRRDQGPVGGQIGIRTPQQPRGVLGRGESTVDEGLSQHLDAGSKTDAVGIQVLGLSSLHHQPTHGMMGQEQGVEFLQDQKRTAAAQGLLAEPLLSARFVDGLFDLPALVITLDERLGGSQLGIEQGGEQAMDVMHLRVGGSAMGVHARRGDLLQLVSHAGVNVILDDAHRQRLLQALARLGIQGGQIAAIGQVALVVHKDALGQTSQHVGSFCPRIAQRAAEK